VPATTSPTASPTASPSPGNSAWYHRHHHGY
jgi:hypothetical protein